MKTTASFTFLLFLEIGSVQSSAPHELNSSDWEEPRYRILRIFKGTASYAGDRQYAGKIYCKNPLQKILEEYRSADRFNGKAKESERAKLLKVISNNSQWTKWPLFYQTGHQRGSFEAGPTPLEFAQTHNLEALAEHLQGLMRAR